MIHTVRTGTRRVMGARQRSVLALALVSVLVGAALGLVAERANADVTLSVSVRASVSATFTSEGVTVLSNTPWQIEVATTTNGHGTVFFSGGPTGSAGETVPVGPEAEVLSVVALDQ